MVCQRGGTTTVMSPTSHITRIQYRAGASRAYHLSGPDLEGYPHFLTCQCENMSHMTAKITLTDTSESLPKAPKTADRRCRILPCTTYCTIAVQLARCHSTSRRRVQTKETKGGSSAPPPSRLVSQRAGAGNGRCRLSRSNIQSQKAGTPY